MTRKQFKLLKFVPIIGPIIRARVDGMFMLANSAALSDAYNGKDNGWRKYITDYLMANPDEYPTIQLIDRLSAEFRELNK